MFAVYAESFSSDDPLSGLVVGERPAPEAPDGWATVTVKAASLNHHDLYWTFPEMLAEASRDTVVLPGDLIGSGTVGTGCILELASLHGPEAFPFLQPGDRVSLEVERLGSIDTHVVEP